MEQDMEDGEVEEQGRGGHGAVQRSHKNSSCHIACTFIKNMDFNFGLSIKQKMLLPLWFPIPIETCRSFLQAAYPQRCFLSYQLKKLLTCFDP